MQEPALTFSGFMKIVRWPNLLILGFTQYMTAIFLSGVSPASALISHFALHCMVLSTLLIAAAGYIINDYYDVKIDLINKPERVVVGRFMKRRVAMIFHTVFNFSAAFLVLWISWKLSIVYLATAFGLWLYSNQLKRLPLVGNVSIALFTGLALYILTVLFPEKSSLIFTYTLFAFFTTLIREIIKDMEDLKGDSTFGCKTLPIIWGIRKTKQFIYLIIIAFIPGLIYLSLQMHNTYLLYYFSLIAIFFLAFIGYLVKADTQKAFAQLSTYSKLLMISGVLSMIFFYS